VESGVIFLDSGAHLAGFLGSKKTVQIGETTLKLPSVA